MLAKVFSVTSIGLETLTVEVEVNAGLGKPQMNIVGLPSKAVQESQERVKTALQNCGVRFPAKKITINLAPADIPKDGPKFDLPIAMGVLNSFGIVTLESATHTLFIGELSLNGDIRPVKGVLPTVLHAKKHQFKHVIIPAGNQEEVGIISGISIHPIHHITQLIDHFATHNSLPELVPIEFSTHQANDFMIDFSDVYGQETVKRALEIAAAGSHNILMNGSPGSGKSMLAKALISILPPLNEQEAIEVTNIYSVAGLTTHGLITSRPFRSPHHTVSHVGLIGGGTKLKPGEISLAHRGILFLDEFPEFSRLSLESLRQPLEDHSIQITRTAGTSVFPAHFTLVAAANPCPCGFALSKKKSCSCSETVIEQYKRRLSGPILDRIDLHVQVQEVEVEKLVDNQKHQSEKSVTIRQRVTNARNKQVLRYVDRPFLTNGEMSSQAVKECCTLSNQAKQTLEAAMINLQLSARSYFKVIKVAQTIADLGESKIIDVNHVAEALQYRPI